MTTGARHPGWRRLAPAVLAVMMPAALVAWNAPDGLPGWRQVGIASAWAGLGLLLASLLLMLREPRLASWLGGLEAMYRWHHRSGTLGYALTLLHPLALAADAWQEVPSRAHLALAPWSQSWPTQLGWVALLLLMAGLGATFAHGIGYRRWRTLHAALGAAVIAAAVHVFVLLGDTAAAWAALGLAVAAVGWRLLVVDRGLLAPTYRVERVEHVAQGVIEALLRPLGPALRPAAGQFVLARFLDGERYRACGEFHPFTASAVGHDGTLQVTVKALGACSWRIQEIAAGVLVRLQGPFGDFLADADAAPQLWVAGGIGVTPFVAALRERPCPKPTTLIYVYRGDVDAAFLDELRATPAADPNFRLVAAATGSAPPDLDALLDQVEGLAGRRVQVCGPAGLAAALLPLLRARGVPPGWVRHESFDFR